MREKIGTYAYILMLHEKLVQVYIYKHIGNKDIKKSLTSQFYQQITSI